MPDVMFAAQPPVAILTFDRPAARNALTWEMYDALLQACDTVDADRDVRVLIIRGAGGAFSAGTDISLFGACRSAEQGLAYEERVDAVIDRLERVTRVTIAQVQGVATGAGCAIAFACDLRVCSPDARFGLPMARTLGNCLSAANTARMMETLGASRFKELILTARLMTVDEVAAAGLVTSLADPDRIDDVTRELARAVAGHAPITIATTKELVRRIQAGRRASSDPADDLVGRCYGSADFREGVDAFLRKRPPQWTGT